jgi:6-pyruvoyltetrahydropterin/6-carboxytetrahydropterin synthase
MSTIRITKEFNFEMAHALLGYNGPCRSIHGHSYYLYVTLRGEPVHDGSSPDDGMVMDFSEMKRIIKESVISRFDHALVLNAATPEERIEALQGFDNLVLVPYQPTCENLLADFAARIRPLLPGHIHLFSLKLCETVTSSAEWFADENDEGSATGTYKAQ